MDRLAGITAFVRVVENGGFSAAGRSLDVSTTMVSDQVQALENALGVRLLNRTTRRPESVRDRPRILRALYPDPARARRGRPGGERDAADPGGACCGSIVTRD